MKDRSYFPVPNAPKDIRDAINGLTNRVYEVLGKVDSVHKDSKQAVVEVKQDLAPRVQSVQLSASGSNPLNVEGLIGRLAQPQKPYIAKYSSLPSYNDPVSQDGSLVAVGDILYRFDGSTTPGTWRAQGTIGVVMEGDSTAFTSVTASSYPIGSMYYITDLRLVYIIKSVTGVNTWVYLTGIDQRAVANLPGSLGVNDTGYQFFATDKMVLLLWTGSAWQAVNGYDASTGTYLTIYNQLWVKRLLADVNGITAYATDGTTVRAEYKDAATIRDTSGNAVWQIDKDYFQSWYAGKSRFVAQPNGGFIFRDASELNRLLVYLDGMTSYDTDGDIRATFGNDGLVVKDASGTLRAAVSGVDGISDDTFTASTPVKTNASKQLVTAAISLSGSEVTNTLPVGKGGTGVTTANANTSFAGPTSGAAAAPSFRSLVEADIPALSNTSKSSDFTIDDSYAGIFTKITANLYVTLHTASTAARKPYYFVISNASTVRFYASGSDAINGSAYVSYVGPTSVMVMPYGSLEWFTI